MALWPASAPILVPLIIGGALIAAGLIVWNQRLRQEKADQVSRLEEEARKGISLAKQAVIDGNWDETIRRVNNAFQCIDAASEDDYFSYDSVMAEGYLYRGRANFGLGNFPEAEDDFSSVLLRYSGISNQTMETALMWRGRTRMEMGLLEDAVEDFSLVIKMNGNYGAAYAWRAKARAGSAMDGADDDEKRAKELASWPPSSS